MSMKVCQRFNGFCEFETPDGILWTSVEVYCVALKKLFQLLTIFQQVSTTFQH